MWNSKAILWGFLGVLFFGGLTPVSADQVEANTKMRSVSGEISSINVKLGKMQLNSDPGQDIQGISEYDINQNETRVVDPSDKKFIVIKDLQIGQRVRVELIDKTGETMIRKIIAEPMLEPVFQKAIGELKAIDTEAGTLVIQQQPLTEEAGRSNLSYFVFEPKNILIMNDSSMQPVQLKLSSGDLVEVGFVVKDEKQYARSITLLKTALETTSTTTTTVTSTTVTQ
jgi:hypothetical protein